jgi:hypothetical protein
MTQEQPYPHPERHEERRRRAHIAEILATEDWVRFGSGQTAETIPDNCFAERKATYTREGGRHAPWSEDGDAAAIADRIMRPGTIANRAYFDAEMPDPTARLTDEQRDAVARRREARRRDR